MTVCFVLTETEGSAPYARRGSNGLMRAGFKVSQEDEATAYAQPPSAQQRRR